MTRRRAGQRRAGRRRAGRALLYAATASYAANCALGAGVALRVINTRRCRWLHHALYVATTTLTATATAALAGDRSPAAVTLVPALVPLTLMPRTSARSPRHAGVGLSAAPFFILSLARGREPGHGVL